MLKHITMKMKYLSIAVIITIFLHDGVSAQVKSAQNPVIWADVPDMSMIRVGDTYYMSSTTMHMSPGVPIMKSRDLVNWQLVNYAYDILDDVDALNLNNGESSYGRGSWASSIRYHNGTLLAEVKIPEGTGWNTVNSRMLKFQKGIHNLVVVLKDNNPVEVDWIQFIN